jgi:branched-chain amino acid transport system ATP-binding protein
MTPVLETRALEKRFGGIVAANQVSLRLEKGARHALIGPNGAGKTTFMNAVSSFVPLTAGRVSLAGDDVTGWSPQKLVRLGLVRTFQDSATFPELTVFENVELGALGAGLSRRAARARAGELIEGLGLTHLARLPATALPHGDERRVGIARAVAVGPKFLLLDEPAAGLDDAESLELTRTIARVRDDLGCGVLLVEHDMRIIFRVCERIQVLDNGKTIAVGSPEEISTSKEVVAAYLGQKGAEIAQAQ